MCLCFWHPLTPPCLAAFPHFTSPCNCLFPHLPPLHLSAASLVCWSFPICVFPYCACGGSLPCLRAGARSRERVLDRPSVPWQNRNRISLRRINPAALSPVFVFFSLHLLGQSFQTVTHKVQVNRHWQWFTVRTGSSMGAKKGAFIFPFCSLCAFVVYISVCIEIIKKKPQKKSWNNVKTESNEQCNQFSYLVCRSCRNIHRGFMCCTVMNLQLWN